MNRVLYQYEIVKGSYAIDDEIEILEIDAYDLLYQFERDNGDVDGVTGENIMALITEIRLYGYNELSKRSTKIKNLKINQNEDTIYFGLDDGFHNIRIEIESELYVNDEKIESCYEIRTNFNF